MSIESLAPICMISFITTCCCVFTVQIAAVFVITKVQIAYCHYGNCIVLACMDCSLLATPWFVSQEANAVVMKLTNGTLWQSASVLWIILCLQTTIMMPDKLFTAGVEPTLKMPIKVKGVYKYRKSLINKVLEFLFKIKKYWSHLAIHQLWDIKPL